MQETPPISLLAGICHPGVHGQHLEEIIWLGSGWMVGVGERFMSCSLGCKSSCNWDFSLPSYPREAECSSCGARLRDGRWAGCCGARMLPGFLCDFWHWGDLLVCEGHPILAQEGERPGPYFPLSLPPLSPPLFFPCLGFPSNPPWHHPHLQHPWVQPQPLLPGQIWVFFIFVIPSTKFYGIG